MSKQIELFKISKPLVYVYINIAQFTPSEVQFIKHVISNAKHGYSSHISFIFNTTPTETLSIHSLQKYLTVIVFKFSKSRIQQIYPNEQHIHNMSFTTIGRHPTTIVFNSDNWNTKPAKFTMELDKYRTYLINHEFGHALGLLEHQKKTVAVCPLMYQQTLGTENCKEIHLYPTNTQLKQVHTFVTNVNKRMRL